MAVYPSINPLSHNSLLFSTSSRSTIGPETIPQPEPLDRLRHLCEETDEETIPSKNCALSSWGAGRPEAWIPPEQPNRPQRSTDENRIPAIAPGCWGPVSADVFSTPELPDYLQPQGKAEGGTDKGNHAYSPQDDEGPMKSMQNGTGTQKGVYPYPPRDFVGLTNIQPQTMSSEEYTAATKPNQQVSTFVHLTVEIFESLPASSTAVLRLASVPPEHLRIINPGESLAFLAARTSLLTVDVTPSSAPSLTQPLLIIVSYTKPTVSPQSTEAFVHPSSMPPEHPGRAFLGGKSHPLLRSSTIQPFSLTTNSRAFPVFRSIGASSPFVGGTLLSAFGLALPHSAVVNYTRLHNVTVN